MKKRVLSLILTAVMLVLFVPNIAVASTPNLDSATDWAHDGIQSAFEKGFIPSDLQSNYTAVITRAEFCRMAVKWLEWALGKDIDTIVAERGDPARAGHTFNDTSDPAILAAYRLGVTDGESAPTASVPGRFNPNGQFTREQAARMIMNTCRAIGANIDNPPVSDFTDLDTAADWAKAGINFVRANSIMSGTSPDPTKPTFSPKRNYTRQESIVTFDNIKPDTLIRNYSDDELRTMQAWSAERLRAAINTRADAVAFLNIMFPSLWHSLALWQGANSNVAVLRSGQEIFDNPFRDGSGVPLAGRSDIATAVAYLLSDNAEIGSLYGFCFVEDEPIKAANYMLLDGEYIIFDSVIGMDGDINSRNRELFPAKTVSTLSDYIKEIETTALSLELDSVYAVKGGQGLRFTVSDGWAVLNSPAIEPLFANKDKDMTDPANIEKLYGHIKAENIGHYQLSKILGGLTLTAAEANALVGKSPDEIKEKVKTAGDMFMYMLAARLLLKNGSDKIFADGYHWHHNDLARQVIAQNLGNCGSMANLANFLLEGDYDEIGFIIHSYPPGGGGGHVYNYLKYEGKYYIVDFSSYLFSNYIVANEFNFIAFDKLEDYGKRWNECYGGIAAIIAHTSPGTHIPNIFGEDSGEAGIVYYPAEADFTILYQTPGSGIEIRAKPCPAIVPDWTKPQ